MSSVETSGAKMSSTAGDELAATSSTTVTLISHQQQFYGTSMESMTASAMMSPTGYVEQPSLSPSAASAAAVSSLQPLGQPVIHTLGVTAPSPVPTTAGYQVVSSSVNSSPPTTTAMMPHNGFAPHAVYSPDPQAIQQLHTHNNVSSGPYLRIIEQPTNRIRYRYKSEKGSHGGLTGEHSTQTKKTYPTVKLENYRSTGQVYVKASLYTNEENAKSHVHKLMGKHCNEDGLCSVPLGEDNVAVFQNLGVLFIGKKEVPDILFKRKMEEHRLYRALNNGSSGKLTEMDKQRIKEEAEREAKDMNLNSVKICFEPFDFGHDVHFPISEPAFSRPIANQKSPDSGELKIVRMDKFSGLCTGDEEVFLLCEKVNKKEIKVRFFETDPKGTQTWEAFGAFTEADVHHQVAIVFRTPPYRDQNIDTSVQVYLQLYRPKDGEFSEPRPFTYKPKETDRDGIDRKRRKVGHYNPSLGHDLGGYGQPNCFDPESGSNPSGSGSLGNGPGIDYYGRGQGGQSGYYALRTGLRNVPADERGTVGKSGIETRYDDRMTGEFAKCMASMLRSYTMTGDVMSFLVAMKHLIGVADEDGDNAIHLSIIHRRTKPKLLEHILEAVSMSKVNVIDCQNNLQQTPLHLAVVTKAYDYVPQLLRNGANANVRDRFGNTALHLSASCGDSLGVRILANKANYAVAANYPSIDAHNYEGHSPLHLAVRGQYLSVVEELCFSGADPNVADGKSGRTPLHVSLDWNADDILTFLIRQPDIDVDKEDYAGITPLRLAEATDNVTAVKLLANVGADGSCGRTRASSSYDDVPLYGGDEESVECKTLDINQAVASRWTAKSEQHLATSSYDLIDDTADSQTFDSGYLSRTDIRLLDEKTMAQVSDLLDPPSHNWEQLALYLGFETADIRTAAKNGDSPTRYIVEQFETRHGGTTSMLEEALQAAGLHQALTVVTNHSVTT